MPSPDVIDPAPATPRPIQKLETGTKGEPVSKGTIKPLKKGHTSACKHDDGLNVAMKYFPSTFDLQIVVVVNR